MIQTMMKTKLGEVANFVMGQAPPSAETNTHGEGTPFVQVRNFGHPVPRIEEWTTKPLKMAAEGDVLVCIVGATVGKVNLGVDAAITRSIAAVRPKPEFLDQRYLFRWMSFNMLQLRSQSSGSAQGVISKEQLAALEIPLPNLEEQERIVVTLDDYLSRLEKTLAQLFRAQGMLKSAARSLLHKVLDGVGSTKKLSELCSLITDGSHFSPRTVSNGVPYITVRDISDDEIDFVGCKFISTESYEELEKNGCRPLPNDVLFSKDGTVGKVTVVSNNEPFVVLSSLAILRPDQEKILPTFLKLALKSPIVLESALGMKTGTAIRRVVLRNLKNLEIDVPPLEKQRDLVDYVDRRLASFKKLETTLESQAAKLERLKLSLLNAAFMGQLLEDN